MKLLLFSVMQDDDSDLEYELQAFPDVSSEASTEAAACVKVNLKWNFGKVMNLCDALILWSLINPKSFPLTSGSILVRCWLV